MTSGQASLAVAGPRTYAQDGKGTQRTTTTSIDAQHVQAIGVELHAQLVDKRTTNQHAPPSPLLVRQNLDCSIVIRDQDEFVAKVVDSASCGDAEPFVLRFLSFTKSIKAEEAKTAAEIVMMQAKLEPIFGIPLAEDLLLECIQMRGLDDVAHEIYDRLMKKAVQLAETKQLAPDVSTSLRASAREPEPSAGPLTSADPKASAVPTASARRPTAAAETAATP